MTSGQKTADKRTFALTKPNMALPASQADIAEGVVRVKSILAFCASVRAECLLFLLKNRPRAPPDLTAQDRYTQLL
jgi:hypothetical protein